MDRATLYYMVMHTAPQTVTLIALCGLMVVVWCISRAVTIHHYLNHHMDIMVASELKEKESYILALETENDKLILENKRNRIALKIIRNAILEG